MDFLSYCEKVVRERRIRNLSILKEELKKTISPELKLKINNYCKKWEYNYNDVIKKMSTDDMFATFFVKDPLKQNIYELTMKEFIETCSNIKLSQPKPSIWFYNSKIVNKKTVGSSKSIDYISNRNEYLSFKYINENGGSQDNQYQDLLNIIKHKPINIILKCIVAGKYFTKTKLNNINEIYPNSVILIDDYIKQCSNKEIVFDDISIISNEVEIIFDDAPIIPDEKNIIPNEKNIISDEKNIISNEKSIGSFNSTYSEILCKDINLLTPSLEDYVIEPFYGKGDLLLPFNESIELCNVLKYDIIKYNEVEVRDTLLNPPNYKDSILITNPPYLALNKLDNKLKANYLFLFKKYQTDDLYKIFLYQILENSVKEGVIIIPFSFLFSIRKHDINLRDKFLHTYKILKCNLFLDQTFNDTTTNVLTLHFILNKNKSDSIEIDCYLYNTELIKNKLNIIKEKYIKINLNKSFKWLFGGEIYNLKGNTKVSRYTDDKDSYLTNLKVYCIDNVKTKIRMSLESPYKGQSSDRTICSLVSSKELSKEQEETLCIEFNKLLKEYRDKYNSLFLTNYRDKNRKRISFELVFNLTSYLVDKLFIQSI